MQFATRQFDTGGPTLAETSETALLERLVAIAVAAAPAGAILLPGDDAALWQPPAARLVALSQDALVEGVDFRRRWSTPADVGHKAMAVGLSDLAGMGAEPAWALGTLCAPPQTCLEDVIELQQGFCACAAAAGCAVLGGDVSQSDGPIVVDVSVGGTVAPDRALRRSAGRHGDLLVVTGRLGGAAAGLDVLERGGAADDLERAWVGRQLRPQPRIAEGLALAAAGVSCSGDLSDGLVEDARRLAAASGCAVELWLDVVPAEAGLRERLPGRWPQLALGGGEDFELLAAVAPQRLEALMATWPPSLEPLTVVGRLGEGAGVTLRESRGGRPLPLPPVRSRHFTAAHG